MSHTLSLERGSGLTHSYVDTQVLKHLKLALEVQKGSGRLCVLRQQGWAQGIDGVQQDRASLAVQAEGEQQNGAAAKRKRKGPSVKERLMRCQRTERERLTFGKVRTFTARFDLRTLITTCCNAPWLANRVT